MTAHNEIFWELITLSTTSPSCVGLVDSDKEICRIPQGYIRPVLALLLSWAYRILADAPSRLLPLTMTRGSADLLSVAIRLPGYWYVCLIIQIRLCR